MSRRLGDVPIRSDGTRTIFVRDIGTVEDSADIEIGYALVNGRRTVYIPVTKRADASTLSVVNLVKQNIPKFGELDLVLAKRRPGEDRGRLVRREKLVWLGSDPALADPDRPLPLILYPPPSISRAIALEVLERAGRSWRIVCTSSSFSGLNAAALAGLGVTVQGDGFVPAGLTLLPGLPDLGHIEFVIAGPGRTLARPGRSARDGHSGQRLSAVNLPSLAHVSSYRMADIPGIRWRR